MQNKNFKPVQQNKDMPRCNEQIKVKEVRLIDKDGEMQGVVSIQKALAMADEAEVDLIEISPNAAPPVCKIMDLGKFLYEKQKKQKNSQPAKKMKEVKFKITISEHDLGIKIKQAIEFIKDKHPIRLEVMIFGRIANRDEIAQNLLNKTIERIQEECKVNVSVQRRTHRSIQVNVNHV